MRYVYWMHIMNSDGSICCVTSNYVTKTRLHKAIDFYSKSYTIVQLLVQPEEKLKNIQNPCPVGDKTDNRKE